MSEFVGAAIFPSDAAADAISLHSFSIPDPPSDDHDIWHSRPPTRSTANGRVSDASSLGKTYEAAAVHSLRREVLFAVECRRMKTGTERGRGLQPLVRSLGSSWTHSCFRILLRIAEERTEKPAARATTTDGEAELLVVSYIEFYVHSHESVSTSTRCYQPGNLLEGNETSRYVQQFML